MRYSVRWQSTAPHFCAARPKKGSDARQRATRPDDVRMRVVIVNRGAAGVGGLSADGRKKQRPAGNRLDDDGRAQAKTREQIPNQLNHQADAARHSSGSALRSLRCEATPPH